MASPAERNANESPAPRQAQLQTQRYLDLAGTMLVALDDRGRVTLTNRMTCQTLGYRQDELLGQDWFSVVIPTPEQQRLRAVYAELMAGRVEPVQYVTNNIQTHAGRLRTIEWQNSLLTNDDGGIEGVLSSGEDITERLATSSQLERNSALSELSATISRDLLGALPSALERVIDSSLAKLGQELAAEYGAIYVCDSEEKAKIEHAWQAEHVDKPLAVIETDRLLPTPWMDRLRELQPVIFSDIPGQGSGWPVEEGAAPRAAIFMPARDAEGLQGMIAFFTVQQPKAWSEAERKAVQLFGDLVVLARRSHQTLEKLRASEYRWKFALEGSQQGVWDWDATTDEVFFSAQWKQMLGYAEHEMSDSLDEWSNRVHPDDLPATLLALKDHLSGETPVYQSKHRVRDRSGGYRWILDRGMVVARDAEGKPLRMIGTHTDVTEQHQAEQERLRMERELQQSRKMHALGQLTGGVAHEFNNMLAIILGNTGLLRTRLGEDLEPRLSTYLDHIDQAGERAKSLTRQMLTFGRRRESEAETLAPAAAARDAINLAKSSLPSSIEIAYQAAKELPAIQLDAGELQQVLTNLLLNACDAMKGMGCIKVDLELYQGSRECQQCRSDLSGEWVQISVRDSGDGIPADTLAHIFEPFFTTKGVGKGVGKGTGLGLYVVATILEQNGGHILVDTRPGQGTCFRLLFPPLASAPL